MHASCTKVACHVMRRPFAPGREIYIRLCQRHHRITSNTTSSLWSYEPRSSCRYLSHTFQCFPTNYASLHFGTRHMSWLPRLGVSFRSAQDNSFNSPTDNQEEAAKVAILEKAMKGRQPTDLKLRCKLRPCIPPEMWLADSCLCMIFLSYRHYIRCKR